MQTHTGRPQWKSTLQPSCIKRQCLSLSSLRSPLSITSKTCFHTGVIIYPISTLILSMVNDRCLCWLLLMLLGLLWIELEVLFGPFSVQHFGKFAHWHIPCSHMSWYITLNHQCLLFWDPRDRDANFSPTPKRSCRQVVTFTFTTLWNHNNVTSQDSRFKSNAKPELHSRQSVFFKVRYQNEGVLMVIECPTVFSPRLHDISLFLSLSP